MDLCNKTNKKSMSHKTEEKLVKISHLNTRKLQFLCNNSRWKNIGRNDVIQDFSNTKLRLVKTEALQFDLKFIKGLLAATANVNIDDHVLPRRHIIALRNLSRNNNVIIKASDKGSGVVIMDSTH